MNQEPSGGVQIAQRAEDIHGLLYDGGTRPSLEQPPGASSAAAAVADAGVTLEVHGGPGSGKIAVNTAEVAVAQSLISSVSADLRHVAASVTYPTAELGAWLVLGNPTVSSAVESAARATSALARVHGELTQTAWKLKQVRAAYESAEDVVAGLFPSGGILRSYPVQAPLEIMADVNRAFEKLGRAMEHADIHNPVEFARKVRPSAFGLIVAGGGPEGADAVIRGVGPADLLDVVLTAPVGAWIGRPAAVDAARVTGANMDATRTGEYTVGRYLRDRLTTELTELGGNRPEHDPDASLVQVAAAALALESKSSLSVPSQVLWGGLAKAPLTMAVRGGAEVLLSRHALKPGTREVFTGVTRANSKERHMTGVSRRPLPEGIQHDGSFPVTVASTAAAVKDAKNYVSGSDPDGEPIENSTVTVTKVQSADGTAAFSIEFTGTEKWNDSQGFHDIKGIADSMAAAPNDSYENLAQAQRMALEALKDAGAKPGDKVVLSGHSLGGIYGAGLAANREFASTYSVEAVTTFGAPVEGFRIPDTTSVLNVVHRDDLVPQLDGASPRYSESMATVVIDTPYRDETASVGERVFRLRAHDMNLYVLGSEAVSASKEPAVIRHEQRLAAALPPGASMPTETYVYEGREEHRTHQEIDQR